MTQEQLAEALHLTRTSIANLEAGRQRILVHTVVAAANVLGTAPTDLIPSATGQSETGRPPGVGTDAPIAHVALLTQLLAKTNSEGTIDAVRKPRQS